MIANSETLNVAKTVSIQDVANVVAKASRDLKNLLKQLLIRKNMFLNGKERTEKNVYNKAVIGMKEIWKEHVRCLLKQLKNIFQLKTEEKKEIKELQNGRRKILKSDELMIEQCMLLKQESLLGQTFAQNVKEVVNPMLIMKIIQNHLMLFGFVVSVIFIYIINQNITLNDLGEWSSAKNKRKSELPTKAEEGDSKKFPRLQYIVGHKSNRMWQTGGKMKFVYLPPGYLNDPAMLRHSAACVFYQGQCITNDLWIMNLRSTMSLA